MADTLTELQRFKSMSHNTGTNTSSEMSVRRLVHSLGYPYRLHRRELPGCPDLTFSSRSKVIFINGCFWHRHNCKKGRSIPTTRQEFWKAKFQRTIQRDKENRKKLKKQGWGYLTIWECQLKHPEDLDDKIIDFLET